ncbi:MAG: hypothetical protein M3R36_00505 [Bacteroidota bacterium]|nr:hypothetical protein [Bacteroidota bacterium]
MKIILAAVSVFLTLNTAHSDDRKFSYTYESSVLAKNQKDLEVWTTYKGGREYFYSVIENRMEFEIGLTKKLQTAFYLNTKSVTQVNQISGDYQTEFEFEGISSEWKYQVLNKYKDGIGFAPYMELTFNTREIEIESKLIFDKQISKKFLIAFNAVAEYEWEFNPSPEKTSKELTFEFDLGIAYDVTDKFSIGLEARSHNEVPNGEGIEHSSLFIGPNFSYRTDSWFFTFTYLPQLPAIKRSVEMPNSNLILDKHERNNLRLLMGFSI